LVGCPAALYYDKNHTAKIRKKIEVAISNSQKLAGPVRNNNFYTCKDTKKLYSITFPKENRRISKNPISYLVKKEKSLLQPPEVSGLWS
jgi:hypothetical protein